MRFPIVRLVGTATMFAVFTLATGPADAATKKPALPLISATDAKSLKAYVGREVAVAGTVVGAGRGTNDGLRFLDFSNSESRGFVAAIVPAVYPKLKPLEDYVGQVLRVTGTLEAYKKKTQIKITRISQIKVLPPPAPGAQKKKP